jgi:hypothetical protein
MTNVQPRSDLSHTELDGEVVVYDPRANRAVWLNPVAALVWRRMSDGAEAAEIASCIRQSTADPPPLAEIEIDVRKLIDQMRNLDLLR